MRRYAPDLGYLTPDVWVDASNYFSSVKGSYTRFYAPELTNYTTAANNVAVGSAIVRLTSGIPRFFVGSGAKLEEANGTTGWTDRSKGGGYTSSPSWDFCQFGDSTIATNLADAVQLSTGAAFNDLSGSPPKAKHCIVQANCVLLFNLNDGASKPDWWASSDQNSETTWTPDSTNFADKDRLYGGIGGPITAASTWQDQAIAWKSRAMYRGRFTGDTDTPWVWDFASEFYGCVAQFAHVMTEVGVVFMSERDVMIYDGSYPRSITGGIRKYLFSRVFTYRSQTFMTVDEANSLVCIWYRSSASPAYPDAGFTWNWKTGKWGRITANVPSNGLSLTCGVRNVNYEDFSGSTLNGGTNTDKVANLVWGQADAKLYNYSNTGNLSASLETSYFPTDGHAEPKISRLKGIWHGAPTASVQSASIQTSPHSGDPTGSVSATYDSATGNIDATASSKYMAGRVTTLDFADLYDLIPEYQGPYPQPKTAGRR